MDKIIDFETIRKRNMRANKEAIDALRVISEFCSNQHQEDCNTGRCALYVWCKGTQDRLEYPCNWRVTE